MFCSNFSRVPMFCNDDNLKLVPESTGPQCFPSWMIVDCLHKKVTSEDLIIEQKVAWIYRVIYKAVLQLDVIAVISLIVISFIKRLWSKESQHCMCTRNIASCRCINDRVTSKIASYEHVKDLIVQKVCESQEIAYRVVQKDCVCKKIVKNSSKLFRKWIEWRKILIQVKEVEEKSQIIMTISKKSMKVFLSCH